MGRILILGAHGTLGQALTEVFGAENELLAWDRPQLDLTYPEVVSERIREAQPSLIINAAAYNAVDASQAREGWTIARRVNGDAVGTLARVARRMKAILIHYSTDYVFDGEREGGYREEDEPSPANAYGVSKLFGELKLQGEGRSFYLIRTSRLFGRVGSAPGVKENFVDMMLRLGRERGEVRAIRGVEISSPTYAADLARATRELILAKKPFGIYHRTNTGACDWYAFAEEIFRQAKMSVNLVPITAADLPRVARRPRFSVLLSTKLPSLRPWQEALAEYLAERIGDRV